VIKKNIKEHSMGVLIRQKVSTLFNGRPLPLAYEERARHRWVLRIPVYSPSAQGLTTDKIFLVRVETPPTLTLSIDATDFGFNTRDMRYTRSTWNPLEIKITDIIGGGGSEEECYTFLRDWMQRGEKKTVSLEKIDPTGVVIDKWVLYGTFIQEMHNEMVYDNTLGPTTIRLNYDYATLIY